jgi:hypothetical protein
VTSPIQHAVAFRLRHPAGSEAEAEFLAVAASFQELDDVALSAAAEAPDPTAAPSEG